MHLIKRFIEKHKIMAGNERERERERSRLPPVFKQEQGATLLSLPPLPHFSPTYSGVPISLGLSRFVKEIPWQSEPRTAQLHEVPRLSVRRTGIATGDPSFLPPPPGDLSGVPGSGRGASLAGPALPARRINNRQPKKGEEIVRQLAPLLSLSLSLCGRATPSRTLG